VQTGLAAHLAETTASYPLAVAITADVLAYGFMLYMGYLQVQKRVVRLGMRRSVIVVALGLLYLDYYAVRHPITERDVLLLAASLAVLGIGMGIIRAYTVRLWPEGSIMLRQGTVLTAILWIVAVGLHITADHLASAGSASLPLYLGVTMVVQRLVIRRRVSGMRTQPTGKRAVNES
jgi:hypothetical protein